MRAGHSRINDDEPVRCERCGAGSRTVTLEANGGWRCMMRDACRARQKRDPDAEREERADLDAFHAGEDELGRVKP